MIQLVVSTATYNACTYVWFIYVIFEIIDSSSLFTKQKLFSHTKMESDRPLRTWAYVLQQKGNSWSYAGDWGADVEID